MVNFGCQTWQWIFLPYAWESNWILPHDYWSCLGNLCVNVQHIRGRSHRQSFSQGENRLHKTSTDKVETGVGALTNDRNKMHAENIASDWRGGGIIGHLVTVWWMVFNWERVNSLFWANGEHRCQEWSVPCWSRNIVIIIYAEGRCFEQYDN